MVETADTEPRSRVFYDNQPERLKVVISERTNWPSLSLHVGAMFIWLAMLAVVISYLLRGSSSSTVLTILLLVWILIWLGFGRILTNRLQFYLANREVLFIDDQQLIIRRPVSIFGLTNAYERQHVSRFYFSEKHKSPAFDYAFSHVYFGRNLSHKEALGLVDQLNSRLFPDTEGEGFLSL